MDSNDVQEELQAMLDELDDAIAKLKRRSVAIQRALDDYRR